MTAAEVMPPVPQQITPTGVFVTDAQPQTPEWFAARRAGITATDLPKIVGCSDYGNAVSVWLDKRGEWNDTEIGEAGEWGTILEPVVANEWAKRNNLSVTPIEVIAHEEQPWMRAALDRQVLGCPEIDGPIGWNCALEVKTRSAFVAGRWRDDIPDDVLAQVAWQRIVSGYPHIHVACLFGGQRLAEYVYTPDEELEAYLVEQARNVWQHVLDGTPPTAEANEVLTAVLDRMYADRAGETEVPVLEATAALDRYETARLDEKEAIERKKAAKAELVRLLGPHSRALIADQPAYSYTTVTQRRLDLDRFRRDQPELNELYTKHTTTRRLDIAASYRKDS